jgi:hypothetical protein
MTMKKILLVVALGTVIAVPAFGQQAPSSVQHPKSTPPGGIYYYRHGSAKPVSELRSSKRKTSHRKHAATRSAERTTGR